MAFSTAPNQCDDGKSRNSTSGPLFRYILFIFAVALLLTCCHRKSDNSATPKESQKREPLVAIHASEKLREFTGHVFHKDDSGEGRQQRLETVVRSLRQSADSDSCELALFGLKSSSGQGAMTLDSSRSMVEALRDGQHFSNESLKSTLDTILDRHQEGTTLSALLVESSSLGFDDEGREFAKKLSNLGIHMAVGCIRMDFANSSLSGQEDLLILCFGGRTRIKNYLRTLESYFQKKSSSTETPEKYQFSSCFLTLPDSPDAKDYWKSTSIENIKNAKFFAPNNRDRMPEILHLLRKSSDDTTQKLVEFTLAQNYLSAGMDGIILDPSKLTLRLECLSVREGKESSSESDEVYEDDVVLRSVDSANVKDLAQRPDYIQGNFWNQFFWIQDSYDLQVVLPEHPSAADQDGPRVERYRVSVEIDNLQAFQLPDYLKNSIKDPRAIEFLEELVAKTRARLGPYEINVHLR